MRGAYYAQKIVPCECGSTEPYWHGPKEGRRDYCCDECWQRKKTALKSETTNAKDCNSEGSCA